MKNIFALFFILVLGCVSCQADQGFGFDREYVDVGDSITLAYADSLFAAVEIPDIPNETYTEVFFGSGLPSNSVGNEGDHSIDLANGNIYEKAFLSGPNQVIWQGRGNIDKQTLSISGNTLTLSGGNSVTLPGGTDGYIINDLIAGNVIVPSSNSFRLSGSGADMSLNSRSINFTDPVVGSASFGNGLLGLQSGGQSLLTVNSSITNFHNRRLQLVADPVSSQDASTKAYVDFEIANAVGLVATTADIQLPGTGLVPIFTINASPGVYRTHLFCGGDSNDDVRIEAQTTIPSSVRWRGAITTGTISTADNYFYVVQTISLADLVVSTFEFIVTSPTTISIFARKRANTTSVDSVIGARSYYEYTHE